ncbi:MAG: hypothetical protein DRR16_00925 [Candidatus Parabeggiatoa sp. nov. 3]|nr:MAG: hypothetical protein DRR00_02315 [Gammaproteobacteria bacterium]RKZ69337.1 MAG: hypothetical protein DRQ99_01280 [Gammaproteobacteria bacterium]RKZ90036.1 MAG: hypothetical protein DRR16_00925 [Gammaproteobacteria bacterium]
MLSCLIHFGQGSAKALSYEDFDLEEGCINIIENYPLHIFTVKRGNLYQDLLQDVEIDNIAGIPYLNAKGLIELKKESIKPKDQIDVQVLQSLIESNTMQPDQFDTGRIKKIVGKTLVEHPLKRAFKLHLMLE